MLRSCALATVVVALATCSADSLDDQLPEAFSAEPTYSAHIAPLLERYCTACHDGGGLRAGGVELDRFVSAYSNRYRNACVAVRQDLVDLFSVELTPPYDSIPCRDLEVFSMPTGAKSRMTPYEQVLLLRWVETGAPE